MEYICVLIVQNRREPLSFLLILNKRKLRDSRRSFSKLVHCDSYQLNPSSKFIKLTKFSGHDDKNASVKTE